MQKLKKSLSRSTHKLKRTFGNRKKTGDTEYSLLYKTLTSQSRALNSLDSHINGLIRNVEQQISIIKGLSGDVQMAYVTGDVALDNKEIYLARSIGSVADRIQEEIANPFIERCRESQAEIRTYLGNIVSLEKGSLLKQRSSSLIDFEIQESKFASISLKPHSTPSADKAYEDSKINYETAKYEFERLDDQAKHEMRSVIMRRYSELHEQLKLFFAEIMADYYATMGKIAQQFADMKLIPAPEPFDHELRTASSQADDSMSPLTDYEHSTPINSRSYPVMPPRTTTTTFSERSGSHPVMNRNPYPENSRVTTKTTMTTGPSAYGMLGIPTTTTVSESVQTESTNIVFNPPVIVPPHLDTDWYYVDDFSGEREGPITVERMKERITEGTLTQNSYIFCEGMDDWVQICQHPELPSFVL